MLVVPSLEIPTYRKWIGKIIATKIADMSCLSKADLQITGGVGLPAFSGHRFRKLSLLRLHNFLQLAFLLGKQ